MMLERKRDAKQLNGDNALVIRPPDSTAMQGDLCTRRHLRTNVVMEPGCRDAFVPSSFPKPSGASPCVKIVFLHCRF